MTVQTTDRNRWLDIVRATAIILVVNCHIASSQDASHFENPWLNVLGLGGHGVDLFFVLSGWLLGSLLLKESKVTGGVNVIRFWKRRWLRTLPAYYAVLIATLLQAAWQGRFELKQLSYFLFLQGYVFDPAPFFTVSWSLCVEEHFYLIIAPAVLITRGETKRSLIIISLFLLVPAALRIFGILDSLHQTQVRVDQCASGVMLACIHLNLPRLWRAINKSLPLITCIAVICGVFCVLQRLRLVPGSPPLIAFTFMSLVLIAFSEHSEWWRSGIRIPGAYYIATRSYAIYLVHVEAIAAAKHLGVTNFWARGIVIWLISLLLAEVLYRCIERPFMRLRDKKRRESAS